MQNKLDFLLNKYSVKKAVTIIDSRTVKIDGKIFSVLPWRNERRFTELKKLVSDGDINGISVMRTLRIVHKNADLFDELYREFDICQYILSSRITEIFAIGDIKHAVNVIAKTADGYVCSFELSATLAGTADIIDKHEIIAKSGVACDRAADTQIPQSSIYVYGNINEKYTDVDAELFGLSVDECAIVRSALEAAKTRCDLSDDTKYLDMLASATDKSLKTCENIFVEG